jgi:hypothetical protein
MRSIVPSAGTRMVSGGVCAHPAAMRDQQARYAISGYLFMAASQEMDRDRDGADARKN